MMTYEVEMKFRVDSLDATLKRIEALSADPLDPVDQEDHYLAHPARDFASTGEALRLRVDGRQNRITYKGPRLEGVAKTREEIEVEYSSGAESLAKLRRMFEILGFRAVASVKKHRREFELRRSGRLFHLALDAAEGLGTFAEVETIAQGEQDLPDAQAQVQALAAELALTQVEPRSYLRMLLESQGRLPTKSS